ncbi:hypothetical protein [Pseudoruegeria sp. SHC-113]|uniref:hypothetical protein n=1 Tax=Pseudoruegeria sp. SHC-113 TaxID=2855439 RepID=UPI0021BAF6DC|nr:hypothetical protein [Pseudoruegeria sp. SHC-113]MCT8160366.1 hypothetical protein [Pseudoruegeria sp. SHC-113]
MKKTLMMSAASLLLVAAPVLADETKGEVLAFDRVDRVLILTDKTVWTLPGDLEVPEYLRSGDEVHIEFKADGENGIAAVLAVHKIDG